MSRPPPIAIAVFPVKSIDHLLFIKVAAHKVRS
jgi:hypothetical protein